MIVTFVSQCEKNALKKTRRVLDAFANRIGDNTWQTVITMEGLQTVKKMLRQTASKNTAVSCHRIRSRKRTELVWIVGNRNKFNEQGIVPVNFTETQIDKYMDHTKWQTINVITYAAAIAALFHDFGKANLMFQEKLKKGKGFEPYRHEWISLRVFQAFISDIKDDLQWLDLLTEVKQEDFTLYFRDGLDGGVSNNHPIENLPPFAKLIAWLILTHHKMPLVPKWKKGAPVPPAFKDVNNWFSNNFDAIWNSYNCEDSELESEIPNNWDVKDKLPVVSMQWRSKACLLVSEARPKLITLIQENRDWLHKELFTAHLARLSLMLADHYYSSQDDVEIMWCNPNYEVYANTDRNTKKLKQQLDEHLIGVAHHSQKIAKALVGFSNSLDSLGENEFLNSNVEKGYKENFGWQDGAKKLAQQISKETIKNGFFGINMASTGKGKTLANAKIMYAIGTGLGRVRFNVALGLRTLTLQTGLEYRDKLGLNDEQLAIAVGGVAVKQLFENSQIVKNDDALSEQMDTGSKSTEDIIDPELYVDYQGKLKDHNLSKWTKKNDKIEKLINSPLLVSTIDHLIPATEGTKGGKQIGPMLRLLTSDLVLDEPDDFGLEDLPALCRLVHWAAMLGSRVLLSTATMPPALVYSLFQAYRAGWSEYAKANIDNWQGEIACAWFDEFSNDSYQYSDYDLFKKQHNKFVKKRITNLKQETKSKRKAKIVTIKQLEEPSIINRLAQTIQENAIKLHQSNFQEKEKKKISIGLVRMANINPLVAVGKAMLKLNAPEDMCIHYCIYHSRYPLAVRSHIENKLDLILKRKKEADIWQQVDIVKQLETHNQNNLIFIVLASPVAEVGRDHDYDWAIIEPSSMRSIIQIAGRVLRHRDKVPEKENIYLLDQNYKALQGKYICFNRPGFESDKVKLKQHDLLNILDEEQYKEINAIQRITLPDKYNQHGDLYLNLNELEHKTLALQLISGNKPAKIWWDSNPHWCGEVQRQQRFRDSQKDNAFYLLLKDEDQEPYWQLKNEAVFPPAFGELTGIQINPDNEVEISHGSYFWFDLSIKNVYGKLVNDFADKGGMDLFEVSKRFGEVRLTEYGSDKEEEYKYHENLGLYKDLGEINE